MIVNQVAYDEDATDCVLNLCHAGTINQDEFLRRYADFRKRFDLAQNVTPGVKFLREVFGPHAVSKKYTRLCRVWTFFGRQSTVYAVASVEGISWEFNRQTSNPGTVVELLEEIALAAGCSGE